MRKLKDRKYRKFNYNSVSKLNYSHSKNENHVSHSRDIGHLSLRNDKNKFLKFFVICYEQTKHVFKALFNAESGYKINFCQKSLILQDCNHNEIRKSGGWQY